MRWVPLYALTALVTGLHSFYGLMNIVNGARIDVLNCLSLVGAATLLGAAVLLPWRRSIAAKVGFAGSILLWVFYGPLVLAVLAAPFSMWLEIKTFITFRDYVPLMGMLLGPALLIACTTHLIPSFRRRKESRISPQVN
jgi:Zn-dependent protease with chaperone function